MWYKNFYNIIHQSPWYLDPQWWAIAIALFLGTGILQFWFKSLYRPNLQPIETIKTKQLIGKDFHVFHRLIVKNIGNVAAKDVRVLLTYEKPVENFIPIPLNWTHWNKFSRDISRGEPAYIDVLRKKGDEENYKFFWSFDTGYPDEPALLNFIPKLGNIRLEFFEHNHKIGDIYLKFLQDKDGLELVKK